jgi:glyoxylase-like metal-dependent hydrolase (beta-lactamase superfamily II)
MTRKTAANPDVDGVRQGWFQIERLDDGIYAISEPFHVEEVRSHLVIGEERAMLIDTGMGVGDIRAVVGDLTNLPVTVVNSHAHWDHIGGNHRFDEIVIHQAEAHKLPLGVGNERLRRAFAPEHLRRQPPEGFDIETFSIPPSVASLLLSGGERFDLGGRVVDVIHAPGHSPGGIVLFDQDRGQLLSTDVAYAGALYAFGVDANLADYRSTLAMLAEMAPDLKAVYPSHNAASIAPALLPLMRDGLDAAISGRTPDERIDGLAQHKFGEFSILVAMNDPETAGR